MRMPLALFLSLALLLVLPLTAYAGSPHFVFLSSSISGASGDTLTVSGKEAGLGNESQVHIVVTADAQCVNPGGNKPAAGNKQSVGAAGDFPVTNGKADFSLSLTAVFQPDCSPPMSVAWSNIVVTDTNNGITATL